MKLNGPTQQPGESREAYLNRMFAPLTGAEMERMVRDEARRWHDDALQEAAKIVEQWFGESSERIGCIEEIFALRAPAPALASPVAQEERFGAAAERQAAEMRVAAVVRDRLEEVWGIMLTGSPEDQARLGAAVIKAVRDLTVGRTDWREHALELQKELNRLKDQLGRRDDLADVVKQPATEEQGIGELLEANRTLSAESNKLRSDLEHWREEHRAMARRCGGLSKSNSNLTIKLAELQGVLREVRRDNFLPKPLQQAVDAALSWDPPAPKPDPTNDVVGHATPIDAVLDANKSLADDNALQRERIVELLALVRRMAAFVPNAPSPLRTAVDKALLNAPVSTLTEALRSWLENLERRVCVIERQVKERVG